MRYEMIREIFNNCSGNQMRDVDIKEIETSTPDLIVKEFLIGNSVQCEKFDNPDGSVIFNINTDGILQRVSFSPSEGAPTTR
jgi:hypothetical protein